jgi:hypothetical protein
MPGSTDLKAEMADSWKTVWRVEPLPFSVPLRLVLLLADAVALPLLVDVLLLDDELDELDEEHAARATAKTASPAVVTCRLRRRCISGTPYRVFRVSGRTKQPLLLQPGVRLQFVGAAATYG